MIILYITAYLLLLYPLIDSAITAQKGIEHKDNKEMVMGITLFTVTIFMYMMTTMYLLVDVNLF
ncbi:hypothetical protein [Staphylococcus nepalensis]|uniref:hypothetical protein n=1 Tax=Staphylococcus nepalensis TaxID=214473 RepID=UPI000BC31AE8|nr:hypothetical protein [Staphylococcus nepalensis]ATH60210.1 hypothetical protein BJD96_07785 [Staphylococcus nepalensis]